MAFKKMAEEQRHGKSDTKVKCRDKNVPENVKTLVKHSGRSRWQYLKLEMRCKNNMKYENHSSLAHY